MAVGLSQYGALGITSEPTASGCQCSNGVVCPCGQLCVYASPPCPAGHACGWHCEPKLSPPPPPPVNAPRPGGSVVLVNTLGAELVRPLFEGLLVLAKRLLAKHGPRIGLSSATDPANWLRRVLTQPGLSRPKGGAAMALLDNMPPPAGVHPLVWKQYAQRLAQQFESQSFPVAAVGGCGCGGVCGMCSPAPPHNGDVAKAYAGMVPSDYAIPDAARYDPMVARRCLSPIASALTTVAALATEDIPISPSSGCFVALWRKVIAIDLANPQTRQRVSVGRTFVGDCPVSCRNQFMLSDFFESDECLGCPIPTIEVGMTPLNEQAHNEVTNINAAGSVQVQVVLWGVCYPSKGCMRYCTPHNGRMPQAA